MNSPWLSSHRHPDQKGARRKVRPDPKSVEKPGKWWPISTEALSASRRQTKCLMPFTFVPDYSLLTEETPFGVDLLRIGSGGSIVSRFVPYDSRLGATRLGKKGRQFHSGKSRTAGGWRVAFHGGVALHCVAICDPGSIRPGTIS